MLRDFEVQRWIKGQGWESKARLEDASVNELPDRRIWFLPGVGFVKQYAAEAQNRYAREVLSLTSVIPGFARPKLLASEDLGIRGSLILIEAAPGQVLDQVYLDLTESEYEELAAALGRSLGALHSSPLSGQAGAEAGVGAGAWLSPLLEARLHDRVQFAEVVSDLASMELLTIAEAADLQSGMAPLAKTPGTIWSGCAQGWIHGDVHNENVFYDRTESGTTLTFIDFEEAALAPVELDLVHPFLNILGEAFPGREFGDDRGADHPILQAFFSAYGAAGPRPVPWQDVAPHAVAWYLGIARDATKAGIPAASFYFETALSVAGLLGWVTPRNENGAPRTRTP